MEGAVSGSQTTGGTDATYHANGTIELRDPDTGTTMKDVTWSGPDAGSYTSDGTDATFVQFSRNLTSATLEDDVEAMQINHCLNCHDSDGSAVYAPGGGTTDPFASSATLVNIDTHFNTSNSSYHPVKGKQNNTYADNDRMYAPWNGINKTEGTLDANSWGYLMSCWDCHANPSDSGTITKTVTAHGGANTLRGTSWVNNDVNTPPTSGNRVTLCVICHAGYSPGGTQTGHGTGSAAYDLDRSEKSNLLQYGCFWCHGSSVSDPGRPTRAEDVHGFNGSWGGGNAQVAFIRNTDNITNHQPLRIGGTTYTPRCTGMNNGGNVCDSNRDEPYDGANGPGGVY